MPILLGLKHISHSDSSWSFGHTCSCRGNAPVHSAAIVQQLIANHPPSSPVHSTAIVQQFLANHPPYSPVHSAAVVQQFKANQSINSQHHPPYSPVHSDAIVQLFLANQSIKTIHPIRQSTLLPLCNSSRPTRASTLGCSDFYTVKMTLIQ